MWFVSAALADGVDLDRGRDLFLRNWVPADPRAGGDGLGPRYNDTSCVACHSQAGVGGSGGASSDVRLRVTAGGAVEVLHRYGGPADGGNSARSSPALFGAGILDQIPAGTITRGARRPAGHREIRGTVSWIGSEVGRFGWKADAPSLAAFVERACEVELGLDSPTAPDQSGTDLRRENVDALTAYVASLPAPARSPGAERGHAVFRAVGCAACHVERLGDVEGVYSDLLLHDMGPALADGGASYYFADGAVAAAATQWRTPPLWGLRDSAPYLHDGRAATVLGAVDRHAGEAERVVGAYRALSTDDRDALEVFLLSLRAPRP